MFWIENVAAYDVNIKEQLVVIIIIVITIIALIIV